MNTSMKLRHLFFWVMIVLAMYVAYDMESIALMIYFWLHIVVYVVVNIANKM